MQRRADAIAERPRLSDAGRCRVISIMRAIRRSLELLVRRLRCMVQGHPCVLTGRHAILLIEWRCTRCGGLFVSHVHHGATLVSHDAQIEQLFRFTDALRAQDVLPPNAQGSATEAGQ